jgi:hypothetical protein
MLSINLLLKLNYRRLFNEILSEAQEVYTGYPNRETKIMRFLAKHKKFILDKMSEGFTVTEICRKWSDQVPSYKTVYRHSLKDKEWADDLNQGYTLWYFMKRDEMDYLSKTIPTEIYPELEFKEALALTTQRIRAIQFDLGKMAPIMSKKFDKADKLVVKGLDTGPQIQVLKYYGEPTELKDAKVVPTLGDN